MRNLSSKWKEKVKNGMDVHYLKYADITLTDGTVLNLGNADLWQNGMAFEDSVSGDNSFDIGSAIINVLTLSINNFEGQYSSYDFDGAKVVCYIGLKLDDGTTEKIRICTATVIEQPEDETVSIDLTCEDNMRKFDRDYAESKLQYPATRGQIIRDACEVCGVTLQTYNFDNNDYIVQTRPSDDALTFRQVLQWVAQIGCQWLRCDEYGRLCVKWYDTEKTDAQRQKIGTTYGFTPQHTDVVITGVQVTEYTDSSDEEVQKYAAGTQGYVLAISNNKLIRKGDGATVASMIAEKCVGMIFRPFESECPTDVSLEAGDAITIEDRNGKLYNTYLTATTLQPGSGQSIACNAKSAAKNSSVQYSQNTQAYVAARKMVKAEKTAREKALKELAERLSESSGVFTTVQKQENGSNIYYLHNKPNLEDSDMVWKMTAEAWAVSTDGGKTWNGGMTVDGDVITRILTAEGINADWINTGTIKGVDEDGNIKFLFDVKTGRCVINLDELQIQGKDITQVTEEKTNQQINKFIKDTYAPSLNNLQSQVDGKIQTWHQDTDPSLEWENTQNTPWKDKDGNPILDMDGNPILMDWEDIKSMHEGDLWYNTSNNTQWIYQSGMWVPQDIPNSVLNIIKGKSSIYVKQPVPPYEKGDLWLTSMNNKEAALKIAIITRVSGDFVDSDWIDFKYVDKNDVKNAISEYDTSLGQDEIFNKLTNGGTKQGIYIKDGVLYINAEYILAGMLAGERVNCRGLKAIDKNNNTTFDIDKEGNVTIKPKTFVLTNGDTIYSIAQDTADSALSAAKDYADSLLINGKMTKQEIINVLSDNSNNKGLYLINGELYINASYINTGELAGWIVDATNQILKSKGVSYGGTLELDGGSGRIYARGRNSAYVPGVGTIYGTSIEGSTIETGTLYSGGVTAGSVNSSSVSAGLVTSTGKVTAGSHIEATGHFYSVGTGTDLADLSVRGTKKRILPTKNYGTQAFYCYEMASPIFGDIGEAVISEDGTCLIDIDDIFQESTNVEIEYYVFLQKEGEGDCWIDEKEQAYFTVKGTPGLKFAFEIKARQSNYECMRFADASETAYDRAIDTDMPEPDYSESLAISEPDYETELIDERTSIINQMEVAS